MSKDSNSRKIGLYVTVIFHITVIAVLMGVSLKKTIDRSDNLLMEFMNEQQIEELKELEEKLKDEELNKKGEEALYQDLAEIKNIAIDESGQLKDDRGTDAEDLYKRHEELMKELENAQKYDTDSPEEEAYIPEDHKKDSPKILPNKIENSAATITFKVEGRNPIYYGMPAYKCMHSGLVTVQVIVGRNGNVTDAKIIEEQSDTDPCIQKEALAAAKATRFTASETAPKKTAGTIVYIFIRQY